MCVCVCVCVCLAFPLLRSDRYFNFFYFVLVMVPGFNADIPGYYCSLLGEEEEDCSLLVLSSDRRFHIIHLNY